MNDAIPDHHKTDDPDQDDEWKQLEHIGIQNEFSVGVSITSDSKRKILKLHEYISILSQAIAEKHFQNSEILLTIVRRLPTVLCR